MLKNKGVSERMRCLALFAWLLATGAAGRVNYCGARMCRNTNAHTFCQYPPGPSEDCTGYIDARLTKEEKSRVLSRLNRRRCDAANGHLRGLPPAGDMMKLRWIEELAKEAQLWADQCRPPSSPEERDECRDLYSTSVGQCVASVMGEAPGLHVESMVDMWYMQSLLYKGNVTTYIPPEREHHFYGDFGQMLWSRSYMVGCGRSRFMVFRQGRLRSVDRLVCNVSPAGPGPNRPLWSQAPPASNCPPRSRPDYTLPGLCNYQLEMNVSDMLNNSMSIQEHVLLNSALETEKNQSLSSVGSIDELYLTNLAIVTMEAFEKSTPIYNSIKKRDIVQEVEVINYNVDKHNIKKNKLEFHKTSRNKISTIGRPKTYNMAELTEFADDKNEENLEIFEDTKNIVDIYGDYNIVDLQEENGTLITETTDATIDSLGLKKSFDGETSDDKLKNVQNESSTNESIATIKDYSAVIQETNVFMQALELSNITDLNLTEILISDQKRIEDYNDPETVRQLQEALDRMENVKGSKKFKPKVRRELRDDSQREDISNSTSPPDKNTTEDRGPMMNMVMKYMPILKEYETQILGTTNTAYVFSNNKQTNVCIVLIMCVINLTCLTWF